MSVSVLPGMRPFTRMPSGAHSAAIDRVNESSADLAAPYIALSGRAMNTPADSTFTTAACALARRWGSAACARNTGPRTFTSKTFCHASGVSSPSGSASPSAALFTTMSMRTEAVDRPRHELVDRVEVAHVRRHAERRVADGGERGFGLRARVRLATRDDHRRAGVGEALGDGAADAARAAGDDRRPDR